MFEVSTSWINGLGQVLVYSGVLVLALWILSKVELPDRGDSPRERERGGE
jgi:hypothetical protein